MTELHPTPVTPGTRRHTHTHSQTEDRQRAINLSMCSPSTGMHGDSFRIPQSRHNVPPGLVRDFEGHHGPVGARGPEQDFGRPVVGHGIDRSDPVA